MADDYCRGCDAKYGHLWDRFSVSRNEVNISACPKCGSRHVEVEVFEPDFRKTRTKTVVESKPPEEGGTGGHYHFRSRGTMRAP